MTFRKFVFETSQRSKKLFFEASEVNKGPILQLLKKVITKNFANKSPIKVLEIASGTGQHAVYFCKEIQELLWQPSDIDKENIDSIKAYLEESQLPNLKDPIELDVSADAITPSKLDHRYDMLVAINLIHVSPWKCSEELFSLAGNVLCPKGVFLTYGAYSVHGKITPDSNVQFNKYLKSQNPEWGLRDTDDLEKEARKNGLELETMFDMPANNKTLLWRRLHSTKL
ncbi:UNVERIFIED_CONTAM: hypothetical protein RMT77_012849 [Armadillidium vulgare]